MRILLLVFILVLTACATQTHQPESGIEVSETQKEAWVDEIKKWRRDSDRLESVSFRVLIKGIDYCKKLDHTATYLGFHFWSNQQLQPEWREVAQSKLNLGSKPQISFVVPSSPSDTAGLRAYDKIVEINGVVAQTVPDTLKMINEASATGTPVTFTILRSDGRQMISVTPVMSCKSKVIMGNENSINTTADGEVIQVSRGLLNFARSDDEVAAIVSHQLAHNARKHQRTNKITGVLGGVVGGIFGGAADVALGLVTGGTFVTGTFTQLGWEAGNSMAGGTSVSQLQQADQDSLHLMSMAGYEIENVPAFWRRVQEFDDPEIINGLRNSHPFLQERFLTMEATQKEITERIQRGDSPSALNL